jgi:hypothetical protein
MRQDVTLSLADVLFAAGAIITVIGLALLSVPLALVVSGASLLAVGVILHLRGDRGEKAGEQAGQPSEATADSKAAD